MIVDRKILWGIAVIVIWFTASLARAYVEPAAKSRNSLALQAELP